MWHARAENRNAEFWGGKLRERFRLEEVGIDGRIIFKRMYKAIPTNALTFLKIFLHYKTLLQHVSIPIEIIFRDTFKNSAYRSYRNIRRLNTH
jgi:hypothetical protein